MTTRVAQPTNLAFIVLLLALAISIAMLSRGTLPSASAGGGCPNANSTPSQASEAQFKTSITCLIQNERTSRGLNPFRSNGDLQGIQSSHVKKMVQQDCFDHRCNGEATLTNRIFASGYLDGADSYRYGENLGYEMTPNEMIDRWMLSNYHRDNILGKFKDMGIAVEFGAPVAGVSDAQHVTYSTLFAKRRP